MDEQIGDIVEFKYLSSKSIYGKIVKIIKVLDSINDMKDELEFEIEPLNGELDYYHITRWDFIKVYREIAEVKKENEVSSINGK